MKTMISLLEKKIGSHVHEQKITNDEMNALHNVTDILNDSRVYFHNSLLHSVAQS